MKTVIYLALLLVTTSCSTINYYGTGKLKKVRVDKSSEVAKVSNQEIYHDSLEEINDIIEIQNLDPIILKEVPNKSSKACVQTIKDLDLNSRSGNAFRQIKNWSLSPNRFKTISTTDKITSSNFKQETSQFNRGYITFEELGKTLLMVLLTIAGILLLLLLIWVFTAFTEIALLVLGYIAIIALIVFVIGFPIYFFVSGDSVDGKVFAAWLSCLSALLGGIALSKK